MSAKIPPGRLDCSSAECCRQCCFGATALRPSSHFGLGRLFENEVRLNIVSSRGQYDCGSQNEASADPRKRAQVLAKQFDSEDGPKCGFDVQKDSRPRCGHMVDAPVPQDRRGCGAGEAANCQCCPCS